MTENAIERASRLGTRVFEKFRALDNPPGSIDGLPDAERRALMGRLYREARKEER